MRLFNRENKKGLDVDFNNYTIRTINKLTAINKLLIDFNRKNEAGFYELREDLKKSFIRIQNDFNQINSNEKITSPLKERLPMILNNLELCQNLTEILNLNIIISNTISLLGREIYKN